MNYDNFTKEQLISILKDVFEYQKQIEFEKDSEIQEKDMQIDTYKRKNEQLHSIIKKVREIVKWAYKEDEYQGGIYTIEQILDKVKEI